MARQLSHGPQVFRRADLKRLLLSALVVLLSHVAVVSCAQSQPVEVAQSDTTIYRPQPGVRVDGLVLTFDRELESASVRLTSTGERPVNVPEQSVVELVQHMTVMINGQAEPLVLVLPGEPGQLVCFFRDQSGGRRSPPGEQLDANIDLRDCALTDAVLEVHDKSLLRGSVRYTVYANSGDPDERVLVTVTGSDFPIRLFFR